MPEAAFRLHHARNTARLLCLLLCLIVSFCLAGSPARASLLHLEGPIPPDLGVHDSQLSPCQGPSHCAWTRWPVDNPERALEGLLPAVLGLDGVNLVETDARYLHATITSRLFGFVDDLELLADPSRGEIQARSLSRLGDSDLGVNARRLEQLHLALLAISDAPSPPRSDG